MRTTKNNKIVVACLAAIAGAAVPFALTGCNTVDGAGEDLQEASENTSEAIDDATD